MQPQIIGISGSPIKNSNTDRLVQTVLDSSGLNSEFVKLSQKNIRPCMACKKCVPDNICKVKDDFQELAEKIKTSGAAGCLSGKATGCILPETPDTVIFLKISAGGTARWTSA